MTNETEITKVINPYTDCVLTAHVSPKSLRKLVRKVKQGNEQAMDRLCSLYLPVVASVYSDALVKYLLGEDAVSIVWEHFLRLIKTYQGNDFKRLPGLIKVYLLRRLKNDFKAPGSYKANVVPDSETLETTPKQDRALTTLHENASFHALLKGCTKKQVKIAELIYMHALEKSYVASILHVTRMTIERADKLILEKAKNNYYKQQHKEKKQGK